MYEGNIKCNYCFARVQLAKLLRSLKCFMSRCYVLKRHRVLPAPIDRVYTASTYSQRSNWHWLYRRLLSIRILTLLWMHLLFLFFYTICMFNHFEINFKTSNAHFPFNGLKIWFTLEFGQDKSVRLLILIPKTFLLQKFMLYVERFRRLICYLKLAVLS